MSDSSPCPNCGVPLPTGRFRVECPHCNDAGASAEPASGSGKLRWQSPDPAAVDSREFGAAVEDSLAGAVRIGDLPVPAPEFRKLPSAQGPSRESELASLKPAAGSAKVFSPPSPLSKMQKPALPPVEGLAVRSPSSGRGNRWAVTLVLALFSIGSVALITALIAWLANRANPLSVAQGSLSDRAGTAGQTAVSSDRDARQPGRASELPQGSGGANSVRPSRSVAFKPTAPRHYKAPEIGECWRAVRQRMLLLEVQRPEGKLRIPAVILDSRGWIATSFSAVAGSSSIVARLAPVTIHDYASARDLSAPVTQAVATRPDLDLVLLEVDRRLVEVIGPTAMAGRTPVAGTCLLAIGPAPTGFAPWLVETRVVSGDRAEPADGASREDGVSWLVHDRPASIQAPGAALFSLEGQLVGINTALTTSKAEQNAVPAEELRTWMDDVLAAEKQKPARIPLGQLDATKALAAIELERIPDVTPAPGATGVLEYPATVLSGANSTGENADQARDENVVASGPAPLAAAGDGSAPEPVGPLIEGIDEAAAHCTRFGFVPGDAAEYQLMVELARQLARAQRLIEIPEDQPGSLERRDWMALDGVVSDLAERILANIRQASPVKWDQVTALCLEQRKIEPTGPGMLFGMTLLQVDVCPPLEGQPATLFELERADAAIIVPTDPERRTYRQQTRWLLFGNWLDLPQDTIKTTEKGDVTARPFAVGLALGPVR